jgi:hypothetical protein
MILNELVSDRVTIKETHFVYNKPKLVKSVGNKYKRKALNMLSKNMIVNRVVTGAGKRIICTKVVFKLFVYYYKFKKTVCRF